MKKVTKKVAKAEVKKPAKKAVRVLGTLFS